MLSIDEFREVYARGIRRRRALLRLGVVVLSGALLAAAVWLSTWTAHAHDIWINRGAYRNPAGEWCCGVEDCGVVQPGAVHATGEGYVIKGTVTYGAGATGDERDGPTRTEQLDEVVPYSQALPSPDGAFYRCRRPDGSRRCFFALKPGS